MTSPFNLSNNFFAAFTWNWTYKYINPLTSITLQRDSNPTRLFLGFEICFTKIHHACNAFFHIQATMKTW